MHLLIVVRLFPLILNAWLVRRRWIDPRYACGVCGLAEFLGLSASPAGGIWTYMSTIFFLIVPRVPPPLGPIFWRFLAASITALMAPQFKLFFIGRLFLFFLCFSAMFLPRGKMTHTMFYSSMYYPPTKTHLYILTFYYLGIIYVFILYCVQDPSPQVLAIITPRSQLPPPI